jgi:hypothetical protein
MTNYQKEQFMLEEQFVKRMLIDYGIREVTTAKQAKNGTREFEFPVPCYSKPRLKRFKKKKYDLKDLPRLRIASFKSGYVRKQNGAYTAYQINPVYTQNTQHVKRCDSRASTYISTNCKTKLYTTILSKKLCELLNSLNPMQSLCTMYLECTLIKLKV